MKNIGKYMAMLALSITMVACGEKNNDEPAPIEPTMTNLRLNVTVLDYSPAPGQFVDEIP